MQEAIDKGRSNKRGLLFGITLAVLGVALSLGAEEGIGSWLTIIGVLYAVYQLHLVGRAGPV